MKANLKNEKQHNIHMMKKSPIQFMKIFLPVIGILFFAQTPTFANQEYLKVLDPHKKMKRVERSKKQVEVIAKNKHWKLLIGHTKNSKIEEVFRFWQATHDKKGKWNKKLTEKQKKEVYTKYILKGRYQVNIKDSTKKKLKGLADKNKYKDMDFEEAFTQVCLETREPAENLQKFVKYMVDNQ